MPPPPTALLLDTNVFVAAVKDPSRSTATFRLLVRILRSQRIRIIGNEVLAKEYLRYAERFPSPTAAALAAAILARMEIVHVDDRYLRACAPYLPPRAVADRVHAATCLQTGAALVSNDRDFEAIARAGVIERWTVAETLRKPLEGGP